MTQQSKKQNTEKLISASAKYLRIAPRKMRLVTNLVKGLYVEEAIFQLKHNSKKGAPMLIKAIQSAAANAVNNFSKKIENLYIQTVTCDSGPEMKRYFPRARGSAFVIRRKMSHVNVILAEKVRGGKVASRLELFKKKQEDSKTSEENSQVSTSKITEKSKAKPQAPKSEEQIKMNKIQNKRRLFNRKSGE